MKKTIISTLALGILMTGCQNGDADFPDYDYQTISFAKQSPIRTVTLGDEEYVDNTLDNEHAIEIKAVLGGVNVNKSERWAKVTVDESMCENVYFDDGRKMIPLPESYYTMASDRLVIAKNEVLGGVRIDFTDAFFADPMSLDVNYVIPLRLTAASDSILSGQAKDGVVNPNRLVKDDWSVVPKDYVFYAVKYKNPYHGVWLSRGTDKITDDGAVTEVNREASNWEKATLREIYSKGLSKCGYTFSTVVPVIDANGEKGEKTISCELVLDIDASGNITVSTGSEGCTASGSGTWKHKGEPKAWGDKDRDLITLSFAYSIEYEKNGQTGEKTVYRQATEERLVMRDRQNCLEEFSFILK